MMSNSVSTTVLDLPITLSEMTTPDQGEQFLQFYLEPEVRALLPVSQLTEVLKVEIGQIVAIPHLPSWVMGVYNWRGEILWMIDPAQMIGLTPWHQQVTNPTLYTVIVLHTDVDPLATSPSTENQVMGLVISQIDDIKWCNSNLIQLPPTTAVIAQLTPFLQGYQLTTNDELTAVLDSKALMAAIAHL
jgi:positive phototaxis protein PixI